MSVSRWDPFQDLLAIQDEMNQVFGRARQGQGGRVWAPALDISERKDAYVVTVEVPGVRAECSPICCATQSFLHPSFLTARLIFGCVACGANPSVRDVLLCVSDVRALLPPLLTQP